MNLLLIAKLVASRKRTALSDIMEAVRENCPMELKADIGRFIDSGYYGEAYEVDGGDKVLKVGVAKTEEEAETLLSKLDSLSALGSDVFVQVLDHGILCDVDLPKSKYMVKSGVAYYYVMEKLFPIPPGEVKIVSRTVNDLEDMARRTDYEKIRKKYLWSKSREDRRDGDIEEEGPDPLIKAADLWSRMMEAGVTHRDMHTKNIMQDADGHYKLIDLESAKLIG